MNGKSKIALSMLLGVGATGVTTEFPVLGFPTTSSVSLSATENKKIKIGEKAIVNTASLDGKETSINEDGSINIVANVNGENLQEVDFVRFYIGNGFTTVGTNSIDVNEDGTKLTATCVINPQSYLNRGDFKIQVTYSTEGVDYPKATNLNSSEELNESVTIDDIKYTINAKENGQVSFNVREISKTPTIDLDSVDGKLSTINADGTYTLTATAKGENLDTIDYFRFYIGNNYGTVISDYAEFNANASQVKVSYTIDAKRFLNGGIRKIRIAYSTDGLNFSDTIALKSSVKLENEVSDGVNKAKIYAEAGGQIEIEVSPIVINPSFTKGSLDGKETTLNADGTYTINASVKGENLDQITNVRVFIGNTYTTISSDKFTVNPDGTKLSVSQTIDGNRYLNSGVMPINVAYATNNGVMKEKTALTTSESINDELTDGLKVFKLHGEKDKQISINVTNIDTEPHFDLRTLDGKLSKVNPDGSFTITATVDGENLNNINRLRIYLGNSYATLPQEKLDVSADGKSLAASINVASKNYLDRGEFAVSIAYSRDTVAYSTKYALTSSQKITNEVTVNDIISKITGEVGEQIKIKVTLADVEPKFTKGTLDGKLSTVNSDGSFTIVATVNGENLQNVERARMFIGSGYSTVASNNLIVNNDGTSLRASINIPSQTYLDRGEFKIRVTYSTDSAEYSAPVVLKTSQTISNSVIRGLQKSELNGAANEQIGIKVSTYNPNVALDINSGNVIPTYNIRQNVSAKELFEASGATVVGDGPFNYTGSVSTDVEGNSQLAQITVTEQSGDQESKTITLKYNVVSPDQDLTVTTGTVVPTYMVNDNVSAKDLFEASESKVIGDGPFTYTGTVSTDDVGNGLNAKITVTEQGGDKQSRVINLAYNVSARPVALKLSEQDKVLKIEQGYTLSTLEAISESGVQVISGDAPVNIKSESTNLNTSTTGEHIISYTATEESGDKEVVTKELTYEVVSKVSTVSQELIPEYIVNTEVSPTKLITDAEVELRDEDGKLISNDQFKFTGTVNTAEVNDNARTDINYINNGLDYAKERTMSVKYKVLTDNIDLKLTEQSKVLKIEQGMSLAGDEALNKSGISVSAGDLPVELKTVTENLDTTKVGEQTIKYSASEQSGDKQSISGDLTYEVVAKGTDANQGEIPEYDINANVSAEQLVTDAKVTIKDTNGTTLNSDKFEFTGYVDTSVVGDEFTTTITYKQKVDYAESGTIMVKYKVNPVYIPLTISEQLHVPSYVKGSTVTAEQLVNDAQLEIQGDGPFTITGLVRPISVGTDFRVNVKIKEQNGDKEEETVQLSFDVTGFDADDFFTTFSNDSDNWGFDDDNAKLLTKDWFDNGKNRGFYSKGYYDLAKPVTISGDYYITGDAVTNAAGISFMFHDGAQTNIGGIDGQLGIMTNDFDPIAKHSIAAALDTDQSWSYDTVNDHMEISYVDDKTLNQVQTYDTGTLNGLRTSKGLWRSWEVKWIPQADESSELSGELYFTAQDGNGVPRTIKQDVTKTRVPQGLYTFKVSGTSGIFQEKKGIRVNSSTEQVSRKNIEENSK